jgi:hypothetical protein
MPRKVVRGRCVAESRFLTSPACGGQARNDNYWAARRILKLWRFVKLSQPIKTEGGVALCEEAKLFQAADGFCEWGFLAVFGDQD